MVIIGNYSLANAQVVYPISELGYCRDAQECFLYCEIPQNTPACWSYGKFVLHSQVSPAGGQVLAESDEDIVRRYGITFPIVELGNCTNINQCKDYCDNPSNQQACIDFAKKKGFHQEVNGDRPNQQDLLARARAELGCTSMESCHRVCEENPQRCIVFARRHGLDQGGQAPPRDYQQGPPPSTGQGTRGPGGCDSEDSCRRYCQDHPKECAGYSPTSGGTEYQGPHPAPGSYLGPGGCKTEEECKAYCQAHPSQCPGFQSNYREPSYQQSTTDYPTYYPQPTYSSERNQQSTYYPQPTYPQEQYQQHQTPQSYPTYQPQPTP